MPVWLILHERIADDLSLLYFIYIIILIFKCIICVIKQVCFSIVVTIHLTHRNYSRQTICTRERFN